MVGLPYHVFFTCLIKSVTLGVTDFFYPNVAPSIAFLSASCADVTALLTTTAWIGAVSVSIVSWIWLVPVLPTKLKAGAVGCDPALGAPPPPPPLGVFTDSIFLTFAKPDAIAKLAAIVPLVVEDGSPGICWEANAAVAAVYVLIVVAATDATFLLLYFYLVHHSLHLKRHQLNLKTFS